MENWNGVPYKAQLVSSSKWSYKCPYALNAKKITYHNTDNSATAQNEADYHNSNNNETSFHIVVDDIQAIQVIPFNRNAWASGDGGNGYGNRNTIHVEVAKNYDRKRNTTSLLQPQQAQYLKAEANAAKVIAAIMKQEGIAAIPENIKRHYDWNGKWCPSKILNEGRWNTVRALIIAQCQILNGQKPTPAKPAPKPKPTAPTGSKKGTIAKWATSYQTGQKISPVVIGKTYSIIQEKNVSQSKSKKAYLLGGIMSWVLEQDLVEFAPKPVSKPKPTPAKPKPVATHKVAKGETLWGIATKYKVTVPNLKAWNGLKSDTIAVGKVLKVTGAKTAEPAKKDWSKQYYTSNPGKVRLLSAQGLRGKNDVNWTGGAVGGSYPKGSVFVISGVKNGSNGIPRLLTQSGFLLTANKDYVVKA